MSQSYATPLATLQLYPVLTHIAEKLHLVWRDLGDLARAVSAFLDPVLSSEDKGLRWDPSSWAWFSE